MMISLKTRSGGDTFYLNTELIESIVEREGNTSEIRLTNGHVYTSIESPGSISNRVSLAQMSSELSKPKGIDQWHK
jgi:uncharacterized protein YlzI (FlbEa/FlbD family)